MGAGRDRASISRPTGQDPREELWDRITYQDRQLDARTEELHEHRRLLAGTEGPEEGRRRSWWREFFGFGEEKEVWCQRRAAPGS
jgi:hypothetical protein